MRSLFGYLGVIGLCAAIAGCSTVEPLETAGSAPSKSPTFVKTDEAVIADKVGQAALGTTPLPWANPSTGAAGVIENVEKTDDGSSCRAFVSSKSTLDGTSELAGIACRTADARWKLNGAN